MAKINTQTVTSDDDLFLKALSDLTDDGNSLVQNSVLMGRLGWDESRFNAVKWRLRDLGRIVLKRGRGGRIGLSKPLKAKPLEVFISYSHADSDIKERLINHLRPLERLEMIKTWHDRKIVGGNNIDDTINRSLRKSDIIILLISVDFINSDYCWNKELQAALDLHRQDEARVVPVIAKNCLWKHMPFKDILALPTDGKAIASWNNEDEALADVAEGIRRVAEELLASE